MEPAPMHSTTMCRRFGLGSLDEMCFAFLAVYDTSPNVTSSSSSADTSTNATDSSSTTPAGAVTDTTLDFCMSEAFSIAPLAPSVLLCTSVPERVAAETAAGREDTPALLNMLEAGTLQHEAATNATSMPDSSIGAPWVEPECRQML